MGMLMWEDELVGSLAYPAMHFAVRDVVWHFINPNISCENKCEARA